MVENGVPHEWYLFNGTHEEAYWSAHVNDCLTWYVQPWKELAQDSGLASSSGTSEAVGRHESSGSADPSGMVSNAAPSTDLSSVAMPAGLPPRDHGQPSCLYRPY